MEPDKGPIVARAVEVGQTGIPNNVGGYTNRHRTTEQGERPGPRSPDPRPIEQHQTDIKGREQHLQPRTIGRDLNNAIVHKQVNVLNLNLQPHLPQEQARKPSNKLLEWQRIGRNQIRQLIGGRQGHQQQRKHLTAQPRHPLEPEANPPQQQRQGQIDKILGLAEIKDPRNAQNHSPQRMGILGQPRPDPAPLPTEVSRKGQANHPVAKVLMLCADGLVDPAHDPMPKHRPIEQGHEAQNRPGDRAAGEILRAKRKGHGSFLGCGWTIEIPSLLDLSCRT